MGPTTPHRLAAAVVVVAIATGCSDRASTSDDTATTPSSGSAVSDADPTNLVGAYLALPQDGVEPAVSIDIGTDQIFFRATCNTHSGPYAVVDGILEFAPNSATDMACEEPDSLFFVSTILGARPRITSTEHGSILLTTPAQTLELRSSSVAEPTQPVNGRWQVSRVLLGPVAAWGTSRTSADIEIGTDEILIDGPCTDGVVSIERSGQHLTVLGSDFSPLPCDEAGTELEDALATIFEPAGVRDFTIIATTSGIDLVPAVAPPEDQLDPAGLSLRPDM